MHGEEDCYSILNSISLSTGAPVHPASPAVHAVVTVRLAVHLAMRTFVHPATLLVEQAIRAPPGAEIDVNITVKFGANVMEYVLYAPKGFSIPVPRKRFCFLETYKSNLEDSQ